MPQEPTCTRTATLAIGGINIGGDKETIQADNPTIFQKEIVGPVTDLEIVFAAPIANAKAMGIYCSQDATVKTNDDAVPVQTIALKANRGQTWTDSDPAAAKVFTTAPTKLFLTCAYVGKFTFKAGIANDATPSVAG